jgi:YrbI family 3-deoxy-D-manno-octulosonate 8-phosphate phosphatase
MKTQTSQYAAIIPVRGGSKSIPLKNIKPINGRPLVYWVIDSAVNCAAIDQVYVSTDSDKIKDVIGKYYDENPSAAGKLQCIGRDPKTATDTASTESVLMEFAADYDFEHMVLIQATSPLLEAVHLQEGIEKYEKERADSLLSVVRQKRFVWKETAQGVEPVNYDYLHRPRRQEFDGYLVENGAFYITTKECLLASRCRISGRITAYEMPEETYYEIDEPSDWEIIEKMMKIRAKKRTPAPVSDIRLFATDCDGCLTDGGMYYSEAGDELKKFNTKDGMGFSLLRHAGIKTAIITGEDTKIVERRAGKLSVDYVIQGSTDKLTALKRIAAQEGITLAQTAYMGDDINDIQCMDAAGMAFTVPEASKEIREHADIITEAQGGHGAMREAAEYVLYGSRK